MFGWLAFFIASCPLNCYAKAFACCPNIPFDTTEFLNAIDGQILSLREKNCAKAYYNYTSLDFRRHTTFEDFIKLVEAHSPLRDNHSIELASIQFSEKSGLYFGTITAADGEMLGIEYLLIMENSDWKIHGLSLKRPL